MGSSGEGSDDSDSEASPSTSGASHAVQMFQTAVPPSATRGVTGQTPGPAQQLQQLLLPESRTELPNTGGGGGAEDAEKECTAETSQNSSIEEDKSSQSPAPSSPTQVEEEVQKECTAETSQNATRRG